MTDRIMNTFKVGDRWVVHTANQNTDESYFRDTDENTIAWVDSVGDVRVGDEKSPIGMFASSSINQWRFSFVDGSPTIETRNKDLIKAEMKVFKDLVASGHIKVAPEKE